MKKLFILILVLLSFVIGCSNESTGSSIDPNAPMPTGSSVYDWIDIGGGENGILYSPNRQNGNKALNHGIKLLGNLYGYTKFHNGITHYKDADEKGNAAYYNRKIFVNGNSVKYTQVSKIASYTDEGTIFAGFDLRQSAAKHLLIEDKDFTICYHTAGVDTLGYFCSNTVIPENILAGYKMYNVEIVDYMVKDNQNNEFAIWERDPHDKYIGKSFPQLMKITSDKYYATKLNYIYLNDDSVECKTDSEYIMETATTPNFDNEITVSEIF